MNILIFSSPFVHVLLARILQNIENIYFCGNNDRPTFLEISKFLPLYLIEIFCYAFVIDQFNSLQSFMNK